MQKWRKKTTKEEVTKTKNEGIEHMEEYTDGDNTSLSQTTYSFNNYFN